MEGRGLAEIDADIDAAIARLDALQAERLKFLADRTEAIVKAFDDGGTRAEICEAFQVDYALVSCILNRAGRSEKQRRALGLEPPQRANYHRLLRAGVSSRIARQIAEGVGA